MDNVDLLLDSDVLIEILRGRPKAQAWLTASGDQVIGIPVLVRMELAQGVENLQEQRGLIKELSRYTVAHLKSGDSELALDWYESFHLSHNIGILDCLIAAISTRPGKPLYSFNVRHYRVIPGIDVRAPYER